MDRNTVIGILLIATIFIGYSIYNQPTKKQIEEARHREDSLEQVYIKKLEEDKKQAELLKQKGSGIPEKIQEDSMSTENLVGKYGPFANAASGSNEFIELENALVKIKFLNKGGKVYSVELKNYKTYDSLPLILFDGDTTKFGLNFSLQTKQISTNELYFTPSVKEKNIIVKSQPETISYRLYADTGKYIEYKYTLRPGVYILDFEIEFVGMNSMIAKTSFVDLAWEMDAKRHEKGMENENNYTTINYKFFEDEVEELAAGKNELEETLRTKVKWIAFKQQFFSSVLIANEYFSSSYIKYQKITGSDKILKHFSAGVTLPFKNQEKEVIPMSFYFGPNKYNILKKLDVQLEDIIPLGKWIIRWVNIYAIIPIFNFLNKFIDSYGIIILLLTIIIKLVLYPLTYRSFLSQGKMRVLKPQIDELGKKFPKKEDALKKQQATMALYRKAGVNPLGGCIPMLLQFPILIAMFRFFPASIELRQQSFLWADDLSTYDSILDLPFNIPMYGSHISLFTLLMTVATIFSMKISNQAASSSTQMPGMKTMMYIMPIMFMFMLNNYSSGLTYYYFLANMITIGQNELSKRFVDDEALLKKLHENVKKTPKKSKFQERLEQAAKKRGYKPKR